MGVASTTTFSSQFQTFIKQRMATARRALFQSPTARLSRRRQRVSDPDSDSDIEVLTRRRERASPSLLSRKPSAPAPTRKRPRLSEPVAAAQDESKAIMALAKLEKHERRIQSLRDGLTCPCCLEVVSNVCEWRGCSHLVCVKCVTQLLSSAFTVDVALSSEGAAAGFRQWDSQYDDAAVASLGSAIEDVSITSTFGPLHFDVKIVKEVSCPKCNSYPKPYWTFWSWDDDGHVPPSTGIFSKDVTKLAGYFNFNASAFTTPSVESSARIETSFELVTDSTPAAQEGFKCGFCLDSGGEAGATKFETLFACTNHMLRCPRRPVKCPLCPKLLQVQGYWDKLPLPGATQGLELLNDAFIIHARSGQCEGSVLCDQGSLHYS